MRHHQCPKRQPMITQQRPCTRSDRGSRSWWRQGSFAESVAGLVVPLASSTTPGLAGRQLLPCAAHEHAQWPQGSQARGSSLLQDCQFPSLLSWYPYTSSPEVLSLGHQFPVSAERPPFFLVTAPHPSHYIQWWVHVPGTACSPKRWSESGSCSTLLFKVGPPRATHTTHLVKFQEASPRLSQPFLHSLPFTMETILCQGKGEEEGWQQEWRPLSISETSVNHRAQRRTRNGEKSKDGE